MCWRIGKSIKRKVSPLQIYESTLPHKKKGKFITFKSYKEKHDYSSNDDLNNKDIAIIAKKFKKIHV
jgi:hypothetical protein